MGERVDIEFNMQTDIKLSAIADAHQTQSCIQLYKALLEAGLINQYEYATALKDVTNGKFDTFKGKF